MRTIDITSILGPDLKFGVAVQEVLTFLSNSEDKDATIDFSKVKFATFSFIDEFYNTFIKEGCAFPVVLKDVPLALL